MAWELLGSTKLTSAGDTIEVAGFTAKKFLYLEFHGIDTGGTINCSMTFNSDIGMSYAIRESVNGGSDSTNVNLANTDNLTGTVTGTVFAVLYLINVADEEKLFISHGMENTNGSANSPERKELVGKWTNTSDQITTIKATNGGTGDYASDSELVVWGTD